jgi:hypothetical protein
MFGSETQQKKRRRKLEMPKSLCRIDVYFISISACNVANYFHGDIIQRKWFVSTALVTSETRETQLAV